MPGETTAQTIDDNQPSVQDCRFPIRLEVWDSLPGGRRVALVEIDGEYVLVVVEGEARTEFLGELVGVIRDGVTSPVRPRSATGEDRGHQAA